MTEPTLTFLSHIFNEIINLFIWRKITIWKSIFMMRTINSTEATSRSLIEPLV